MYSRLYRVIGAMNLLLLLSIPTFVPSLHELLHYHQHLHCTSSAADVHLHANAYDCQLCDYLTTFTFLCDTPVMNSADEVVFFTQCFSWENPEFTSHPGTYNLRGPPEELV
jgi:hypothetical protein